MLGNENQMHLLATSCRLRCRRVSRGSGGPYLSFDPVTWQGHSEVSREKLVEVSSLTPLAFFSEGRSPGQSARS